MTRYVDTISRREAEVLLRQIVYSALEENLTTAAYTVAESLELLETPLPVTDDQIRVHLRRILPEGKRGRVRLVLGGRPSARVYLAAAAVLKKLLGETT